MQIEIGKYYVNKTWRYLLPCLKAYGPTFVAKYNTLFKLAAGVNDVLIEGSPLLDNERIVCILIDKKYKEPITQNILQWFRYQDFFITDYAFDDMMTGRKQMIVLKFPELYHNAYDEFLKGKYSRMFTNNDIKLLFSDPTSDAYGVLMRTEETFNKFVTKVNNSFGSSITRKDLIGAELDFPFERFKEVFNVTE